MATHYKARCNELEDIVELCFKAFNLIPTEELRRGHQWLPSEDALRAIERGKDAASGYLQDHWRTR